jgi:MYXO-CTERM domain-containing protein
VDCQSKLEASCSSSLKGGCEAQCQKPEGALYCDGQYVDKDGNFQDCFDALTQWKARIDASATGSATSEFKCDSSGCSFSAEAEAEAEASCATAPGPRAGGAAFAFGSFGLLAAWALGRRRRRE